MKRIFLFFALLASLSLHAVAWGDMADNGIECTVVMEKTTFDAKAPFPDFMLVFTNKGKTPVRLFDDFYPLKKKGPNIFIKIWSEEKGKQKDKPTAWYSPVYKIERNEASMRYITLYPEQKLEVPIKDAYLLLEYLQPLINGKRYVLEVRFRDGYGEPGVQREYVGKEPFSLEDQAPK